MEHSYKVSIIVPCYNVEEYIVEAIESIREQTMRFEDIQIIIVDDCSKDNTLAIIRQNYSLYRNIEIVESRTSSGAAGRPRNIGIEYVKAEYMMFLDPDDVLEKDALEKLYEEITCKQAQISIGSYTQFDEKRVYQHPILKGQLRKSISPIVLHGMSVFIQLPPSIWCKIYKTDFIKENSIRFPEGIACQDAVFMTECFMKVDKMTYIPENIYRYRLRATSITNNLKSKYFEDYSKSRKLILEYYKKRPDIDYSKWRYEEDIRFILEKLAKAQLSSVEKIKALQTLRWFLVYIDKKFTSSVINKIIRYIKQEKYEKAIKYIEKRFSTNIKLIHKIKTSAKLWCLSK